METKNLKVRIRFFEELLGTASNNPDIHSEFIASKGPDAMTLAEEVEAVGAAAVTEKGMTVFPRDEDGNGRESSEMRSKGTARQRTALQRICRAATSMA